MLTSRKSGESVTKISDIADTVKSSDAKSLSDKIGRADQTDHSFTFQYQITETCNLRCSHCYQDESIVYQASTKELLFMLDKGLKAMEKWHFTPRVPLSGGEPLMSPSLWPLLDHLEAYKKDHEVMSAVLTNGTLIDRDVAETLATYGVVRFVQVSLDGVTAETHNAIRGKGTFEKALKGIAHLKTAGVPTHIHFVVHKQNYEDAFQMVDLADLVQSNQRHRDGSLCPCARRMGSVPPPCRSSSEELPRETRRLGRPQWMRASNRLPRQLSYGRHSPTVTQDSSGEAFVTWKLPMRATCFGSLTPSPTSGRTTCSARRIRRSDCRSTSAMNRGARQRKTLTFSFVLRV